MNCQDISRITDAGRFSSLTDVERRAAEAHALSCRSCAPIWAAHARLAELRIPPMPPELSVRCRTLAALPAQSRGGHSLRRLTLVGSVVALAAAAAMFTLHRGSTRAPEIHRAAVATPPAVEPAPTLTTPELEPPARKVAAARVAPPEKPKAQAQAQAPAPLPLLPAPVFTTATERNALVESALQKAVDRHPELVQGPQIDGTFMVSVVMREDGSVLSSAARLVAANDAADFQKASAEIQRTLPRDGGGRTNAGRNKHTLLPDGRALRADVSLRVATVPMGYDLSRSNVRVLQILGDKYADLLLPASAGELNRLTVFLSEDGHIRREKIDRMETQSGRALLGGDTNDAAFLAEAIANRLEIDIRQIGLMGVTALEEGSMSAAVDENGNSRPNDTRRVLPVYYAWPRRAGDAGPVFGQGSTAGGQTRIDPAAALTIVERLIPDAFTLKDPAAGQPTVVLSAKGELIRAGRVNYGKGGAMDTILQEQLVPGVMTNSFLSVRVRNNRGESADVTFAWEMPPEMAKAMKEAINRAAKAPAATGE